MEPLTAAVYTVCRPLRGAFRWRVSGLEHIPERGPALLASNHISLFDPLVVASVADLRHRRVRFLAMAELFRSPVPRWLFTNLGHIPVARRSEAARSSLTAALTALGWGEAVGIFPEGGLSRDLEPRAGQTGAARLARWSGAPVVPVGLWGTQRVTAPGHKSEILRRVPIAVSIGPPLTVPEGEDLHAATDRIMAAVCAEVARARTGYPAPRPGDDAWWVRAPGTARLRSCARPSGAGPAEHEEGHEEETKAAPRPAASVRSPAGSDRRPLRVGVALSSGGTKTLAHLGVLRVLREAGVPVDAVAGTSGGAMLACGLAAGLSDEEMLDHVRELAAALRPRRFDVSLLPRSALFKGVRLRHRLDAWFGGRSFADTRIPCWVVATDARLGAEVVINRGPLADAVRASLSIPGAMHPWPVEDRRCLDGALVNPLPANVLRDAGVDVVIGSNVAGLELSGEAPGDLPVLAVMSRMVNSLEREMLRSQLPLVDVLIRPEVGPAASFDFSRAGEFILAGERAARAMLPEIRAALAASASAS